ncbi:MAG: ABC transporter permease subunit [Chloroflexi bacterium]|jgi:ABC-2 type transport system permease protein|nr:ABC transporter permease subunit [Chloroflexota bacterium]
MRNIWTIARREYNHYFSTPVAYLIAFAILLVVGIYFYLNLEIAILQPGFVPGVEITLGPLATLMMLATPAITTRLLAEEQRMGTIELLLTAPVRDIELVLGKWLGAFLFMATIVALTLVYPFILNQLVDPGIDQGPLISGYLGMLLLCAALAGIGVGVSSLFGSQIAAFAATMGVLVLLWWIVGPVSQVLGMTGGGQIFAYLDLGQHFFENLLWGIIDLEDVVFYLSLAALGIFSGAVIVESRRWR